MVLALRMEAAVDAFYDWEGGLVWLRMDGEAEAEAAAPADQRHGGGHATLVRAARPSAPRCRCSSRSRRRSPRCRRG